MMFFANQRSNGTVLANSNGIPARSRGLNAKKAQLAGRAFPRVCRQDFLPSCYTALYVVPSHS